VGACDHQDLLERSPVLSSLAGLIYISAINSPIYFKK